MDSEPEIENIETNEETLDPINWIRFRKLGIQMVEDMIAYLEHIRDRPVWKPIPKDTKEFFDKDMWLHVDGAFGALAILSSKMKWIVSGMSKADSLAFDLHKWMYMPYATSRPKTL